MPIKSIKTKILLLLLSLSAVVVLSSALLMRYGVSQGFSEYKKGLEKELNDRMVKALETYYLEQLSWHGFVKEPRSWHELILKSATQSAPDNQQIKPHNKVLHDSKPKNPERGMHDLPRPEPGPGHNHRPGPRSRDKMHIVPTYTLFDDQQQVLIGPVDWSDKKAQKKPLEHKGKVVGYLAFVKDRKSGGHQEKLFNESIVKLLWVIAGVMILATVLITLPVAKYFTRPIRALNEATQKAAAGDYTTRTEIRRADELGQLGQTFNFLTQTLESNAAVQKKMMADISHELRTPVAVLLAQIEALQDGIHEADEKHLSLLHEQTSSLRHLINDLHQLSMTDLGSMQYQMQAVDINEVMSAVVEGQQLLADKQQVSIKLKLAEHTLRVLGDNSRLHQLFTNLINNAINYTDTPGQIVISSQLDAETDEVRIEIKDSPPGLRPQERKQMFDRLYRQEDSRSKKLGGSGLGLAIAKNITEAHHGEIMAKDSDLGGVCLIVRIPKHV